MYDYQYLETLADGEEKMEYLKKCIAEADAEQDMEHALQLRHDYIEQSVFHGDGFKGLLMFPELMKLFDENPGVMAPSTFMFVYKWIIDRTDEYYQISLEQIDEYFRRFREYIDQFGYTLRTYYKEQFSVYSCIDPDPKSMLDLMELSETFERTEMSDCETCEMSERITCELRFGSFEKGMELLREMIERGMRCAEQPFCTFGRVAAELAKRGMYREAMHYAALFLKGAEGDEAGFLKLIAETLKVYTMCDPTRAYELFRRTVHLFSTTKTPRYRFMYADAARRFFERLIDIGQGEIHTNLNSSFEWYDSDGIYVCADMAGRFREVARDLAAKFDERNHTSVFADEMAFEYPDAPTMELDLPAHGRIPAEPFGMLIPFKSADNFPTIEKIGEIIEGLDEFETTSVSVDPEHGRFFAGGRDDNGKAFNYTILFDNMPDLSNMEQVHYLGKNVGEEFQEYQYALIILTEFNENFSGLRRLIKFASALNLDGSPLIADLVNNRLLSSKWAEIEAAGSAAPYEKYLFRIMHFSSAFGEGKVDVATYGLPQSGSVNVLVPAVDEDDVDYVSDMVRQLAVNAVSVNPLPDEGIWFNAGIAYDEKEYLRVKWRPVTVPNEDGSVDEDGEYFAEPIIRFPDGRELLITEIPAEEREKLDLRNTNRMTFIREAKARWSFNAARDFLIRNTGAFGMVAGAEFTTVDEDGDEYDEVIYVEVLPDGTSVVLSDDFDEEGKREGDVYDLDPSRVFTWQLQIGEDGRFGPDDLYFLLIKEGELGKPEEAEEE